MTSRVSKGLIAIIFASVLMGVVAMPDSWKASWPDNWFTGLFKHPKITLGLDLQGGTQLDYRIDLRNAEAKNSDNDPKNDVVINDIVEGVRNTIERRVNGLGVNEPQIYISNVGGEPHIIVELAGIKDIEQAKAVVGKTIQLEFKEQKTEQDPTEGQKIRDTANDTLKKVTVPLSDFDQIANNVKTVDKKIDYRQNQTAFASELPDRYKDVMPKLVPGQVNTSVIEGSDGYTVDADNKISERKGLYILQLVNSAVVEHTQKEPKTFDQIASDLGKTLESLTGKKKSDLDPADADTVFSAQEGEITSILESKSELHVYKIVKKSTGDEEVRASHILIAYKGATRATATVTRTKDEAKAEAEKVLQEVKANPSQFAAIAKAKSDDPSAASNSGDLGYFGKGTMTKAFEDTAFAMKVGDISDVVETEFGFHIIQLVDKKAGEPTVDAQLLRLENTPDNKTKLQKALDETKDFQKTIKEPQYTYNEIFFDMTPDPWKSTGLDGSHFKRATVTYNQLGSPQVSIQFDSQGADLFEQLTGRLVGKPLAIFVGGDLISAPRVDAKISGGDAVITGDYTIKEAMKLANDLNTGAIDAPVILAGQTTISATLGSDALKTSIFAGIVGLLILALFMIGYYRLMGVFAVIALSIYSIIILFILKTTGIVMTLAGIAGIILSIGMAVDANILIFERSREELRSGKNFSAAMVAGFERAWFSIRDSNVSSLITCAILWSFGNSIIRGFALMLALGIVISMFTAITVTRAFMQTIIGHSMTRSPVLLGVKLADAEEEKK
jgi:protein-export membrane protein SecD